MCDYKSKLKMKEEEMEENFDEDPLADAVLGMVGVSELISVKEEEVSGKAEEEYTEDPLGSIYQEDDEDVTLPFNNHSNITSGREQLVRVTIQSDDFNPPEFWKRVTAVMMIRAGFMDCAIMKGSGMVRSSVKKVRAELKDSNNDYVNVVDRKRGKRRSDCLRTPDFVEKVQKKVDDDPTKSANKLAEEIGVSASTIRKCLSEDIRYKFYKRRKGQILTQKAQNNRMAKARKLVNKLKHPVHPGTIWFFSDEKNFTQDRKHNSQNKSWYARNPTNVPIVGQTKCPAAAVMVFGIISSEGDVMPPHFFEKGLRLNSEGYVALLRDVVVPWIKRVAAGRPYVLQQDSAPCHTSRTTQKWLSENIDDYTSPNIWPPNSPDCNPCDFYLWGAVERDTNRSACNTLAELKNRITVVFNKLPRDQVRLACARFKSRLEKIVEVEGAYFE